jgi:hypothetical protein
MSSNLDISIGVFGIAAAISCIVHGDQDRSAFVKNLMESTFYATGQRYNVMVFNLGQNYDDRFKGTLLKHGRIRPDLV